MIVAATAVGWHQGSIGLEQVLEVACRWGRRCLEQVLDLLSITLAGTPYR
jgi:hypothetical protein